MNTGKKKRHRLLASRMPDARAESLVSDWANTATEYPVDAQHPFTNATKAAIARTDSAIERLIQRYPEVFSSLPSVGKFEGEKQSRIVTDHWGLVARVQRFLRLAWDTPEMREREWHIFAARHDFHYNTVFQPLFLEKLRISADIEGTLEQPLTAEEDAVRVSFPAFTPFEQAMYHLQRIATQMRHCPNSECPAPYFLARKKSQKYCSSKCSAPMQREQKRNWWRANRAKQFALRAAARKRLHRTSHHKRK